MPPIVLVKLENDPVRHFQAPPFGLLYPAAALERAGYEVRLYHRRMETKADFIRLTGEILAEQPLWVGFSTLSGPGLVASLDASRDLKAGSTVPIVWGGLHPTMLPEQTLAESCVDIAVVGEGEETVVQLADALRRAEGGPPELKGIAGLAFKDSGRVVLNPSRPFLRNLDDYPPARHLLDLKNYPSETRAASILTSRGCPGRCAYCYNAGTNRRTFRALSVAAVLDQVREIRKTRTVESLNILDDNFFGDLGRAREITRKLDLPWKSSVRAGDVARWGDDILAELAASGCSEFRIGAESGSPRILELLKTDVAREDILTAAERCLRHGIRTTFSFMIGLPGETESDRRMTYDLMDRLEGLGGPLAVNGPFVYFPWPGTRLYQDAVARGYRPPAATRDWNWGKRRPRLPFAPRRLRLVEHYSRLVRGKATASLRAPVFVRSLILLARIRWRRRAFRFPVDYYLPRLALRLLRRLGARGAAAVYDE